MRTCRETKAERNQRSHILGMAPDRLSGIAAVGPTIFKLLLSAAVSTQSRSVRSQPASDSSAGAARHRDGISELAPLYRHDRCFVAGPSATRTTPAGRFCLRVGPLGPRLGRRSRLRRRSLVKDERPREEELLEVSQVRARSTLIAQASPRSSPSWPARVAGRVFPTTVCVGFSAAILTATPAAAPTTSTADLATTSRFTKSVEGDAIVLARLNRLNQP